MPGKRRPNVTVADAKRIIAAGEGGKSYSAISRETGFSDNTVRRVLAMPERYLTPYKERLRKGMAIPQTRAQRAAQSLRQPSTPTAAASPYGPQVADSQITFSFANALLEKATEIVRVLSTQQHPPELMKLVSDTIQAGVDLAVANREAERLEAERLVEEEAERIRKEATAPYPLGGFMRQHPNHTDQIAPPHLVNQYGQDIDE